MNAPPCEVALAKAVMRSIQDTTPGGVHQHSLRGAGRTAMRVLLMTIGVDSALVAIGFLVTFLAAH